MSEIVKLLCEVEGRDSLDRSYVYRVIERRLVSCGEVVKVGHGRGAKYRLTEKGFRSIGAVSIDGDAIKSMLAALASKLNGEFTSKDVALENAFTSFQCKLIFSGKEVYVRIEEGAILPRDLGKLQTLSSISEPSEKFLEYLEKLVNEKVLLGAIGIDAMRHSDKFFLIIINGSDPRKLPRSTRELINAVARKINRLTIERAVDRIESLINQLPGNVIIVFTEGNAKKTIKELESKLKKSLGI